MPRRSVVLISLALALVACRASAQPGTGIRGSAMIGPQCPVEQANSPCPDRPFQGEVQATATDGTTTTGSTDASGRFTIDLESGTYVVSAVTTGVGPPTAIAQTVVVHEGAYTSITLQLDSGIR